MARFLSEDNLQSYNPQLFTMSVKKENSDFWLKVIVEVILHNSLWWDQSAFWQTESQYLADLQRPHNRKVFLISLQKLQVGKKFNKLIVLSS